MYTVQCCQAECGTTQYSAVQCSTVVRSWWCGAAAAAGVTVGYHQSPWQHSDSTIRISNFSTKLLSLVNTHAALSQQWHSCWPSGDPQEWVRWLSLKYFSHWPQSVGLSPGSHPAPAPLLLSDSSEVLPGVYYPLPPLSSQPNKANQLLNTTTELWFLLNSIHNHNFSPIPVFKSCSQQCVHPLSKACSNWISGASLSLVLV